MTDSVKLKIDLTRLSQEAREKLFIPRRIVHKHEGEEKQYFRQLKSESPISGAGMMLEFQYADANRSIAPHALVSEVNVPNAMFGQNHVHSTNGYFAAKAAFELLKIKLAELGVEARELDALLLEDARIEKITLTYMLVFQSKQEAKEFSKLMLDASIIIAPRKNHRVGSDGDDTAYVHGQGFQLREYMKSTEKTTVWRPDTPISKILELAECIVRVEVELKRSFLASHSLSLDHIESWKDARWDGLYRELYEATIGKTFKLSIPLLQKKPKPVALQKLSPNARAIVDDYLSGGDPREHEIIRNAQRPIDAFSKYRLSILTLLGLDIRISWAKHKAMRHYNLRKGLAYPAQFKPPPEVADSCFCAASWVRVCERLESEYVKAKAGHERPIAGGRFRRVPGSRMHASGLE